jgi:hypothetical protein
MSWSNLRFFEDFDSQLQMHERRLDAFSGKRVARRAEPGIEYWQQLMKLAREKVAVQNAQW